MTSTKYIGMDVHKESISIAVRNDAGKIVMECVIETKASMILQFIDGLRGDLQVTFEEGTSAAWLYDLLKPHVTKLVVCDPRKNASAWKRLCGIPSIGPIRAAVLLGILQTPNRFRTKRQLWTYSGFGIETQSSADHRRVNGQLERAKKQVSIRGLNRNCNHDLKNLFKGAAIVASSKPGPFQEFYTALLTKGLRPEMARLTLARKIATIVLLVWKRGACFDAQHLKPQTA